MAVRHKMFRSGHIISYSERMPEYQLSDDDRRKKRKYYFSFFHYIKLLSGMLKLREIAENNLIFLTLTFPLAVSQRDANKIMSNFIDNMKKTYGLKSYCGVLELQTSNYKYENNPHYHFICDYPFNNIQSINRTFVRCIENYLKIDKVDAKNCVRLPNKTNWSRVVGDVVQITRYLAKYISKSKGIAYETRFSFMSNNLQDHGTHITKNEMNLAETCLSFENRYEFFTLRQTDSDLAREILKSHQKKSEIEYKMFVEEYKTDQENKKKQREIDVKESRKQRENLKKVVKKPKRTQI